MKKSVWRIRDEYYFDKRAAYNAVKFFETEIVHIKGPLAGKPLKLERWQRRVVRRVYGWKSKDDHTRKYRTVFIFVPRKNGKSSWSSGFALYGLLADGEAGAEVVSAARDREQASLIFDMAAQIVEKNPRLEKYCTVYKKSIISQVNGLCRYIVLSADVLKLHGLNPSTIIFDELHTQPNGDLVEVLETATHARAQPLTIYCTTAGHDKNSVCYEIYDKAKRVQNGEIDDPTFLPVLYEASPNDDWKDEKTWKKANPNYGVSVIPKNFKKAFNDALLNLRLRNSFLRLHLNIWTEQLDRWLDMEQWNECARSRYDLESLKGKTFYGGIDLSSKIDITAFVLVGRDDDSPEYVNVIPFFWMPEKAMKANRKDSIIPYEEWVRDGYLRTTPGATIDYDRVIADIEQIGEQFNIKEIGFDPYMAYEPAKKLDHKGFTMVEVRQGYSKMSEPAKALEGYLADAVLRHNDNPILKWMASNVSVEEDANGNIRPHKGKSNDRKKGTSRNRIDGIVATIIGLSRLIVAKNKKRSKYEDEGLDTVKSVRS